MGEFPNKATQFKKGNKASPGATKGKRLKTILKELLESPTDLELNGRKLTRNEAMALSLITKAVTDGDTQAAREIWDRFEGKVKQEIGGIDGTNVVINIGGTDDNADAEHST